MTPRNKKSRLQTETTSEGDGLNLSLSGHLGIDELDDLEKALAAVGPGKKLVIDLEGLHYLDTAGAMALKLMQDEGARSGGSVSLVNVNAGFQSMLGLIDTKAVSAAPINKDIGRQSFVEDVGQGTRDLLQDLSQITAFVGQLTKGALYLLRRPKSLRVADVLASMQAVGVEGLPIVSLIGLLLGMIMAFMSSLQLKSFGADIYVATLVAVAMVRELGPIMTSILVAGRSGSAFAAEIGTMRVNEEVDALEVMGFEPTIFLAVPKVIAAVAMVPLLNLFAITAAVFGGMMVGVVGLDLTPYTYLVETMSAFDVGDLMTSMAKSSVFGLLIAVIGCQRGFVVGGGAAGVGRATTGAVVAALFLIIITDSAFAIIQYYFL